MQKTDLLRIEAAGWGNDSANGGQVNFYATNQELEGVITVDTISNLNLYLVENSDFTGSIDSEGKAIATEETSEKSDSGGMPGGEAPDGMGDAHSGAKGEAESDRPEIPDAGNMMESTESK